MRIKTSFLCLSLKTGCLIGILVDLIKISVSIVLLVVYATTGYDKGVEIATQTVAKPEQLKDASFHDREAEAYISAIVVFIGDLIRYSVVGVVAFVVIYKKWGVLIIGTYFWVKFLSSFLNIFASLMMVTLVRLPVSDMILSLGAFAADQYFCMIVYSYWQ